MSTTSVEDDEEQQQQQQQQKQQYHHLKQVYDLRTWEMYIRISEARKAKAAAAAAASVTSRMIPIPETTIHATTATTNATNNTPTIHPTPNSIRLLPHPIDTATSIQPPQPQQPCCGIQPPPPLPQPSIFYSNSNSNSNNHHLHSHRKYMIPFFPSNDDPLDMEPSFPLSSTSLVVSNSEHEMIFGDLDE